MDFNEKAKSHYISFKKVILFSSKSQGTIYFSNLLKFGNLDNNITSNKNS